jgi:hypothetical protein
MSSYAGPNVVRRPNVIVRRLNVILSSSKDAPTTQSR